MTRAYIDVVIATAITGGGPTQAITGSLLGETPKAVMILATRAVTTGTIIDGAALSVGFSDGTNQFCNSWAADDGVRVDTLGDTARRFDSGKVVQVMTTECSAAAIDGEASISSFSADTVTISWSTLPSTAIKLVVVFFYGADLQAAVGSVSFPAVVDTSVTVSGLAFAPNAVLFASAINGYSAGGNAQTDLGCLGVANLEGGTITQSCLGWGDRDQGGTTATVATSYLASNRALLRLNTAAGGSGSLVSSGEITSFTSDGFVGFTRVGSSAIVAQYLALNTAGLKTWVGNPALTTSATGTKSITSPGWRPGALFVCGSAVTVIDSQRDTTEATHVSIGAARSGSEASTSYQYEDGLGTGAGSQTDTRCLTQSKLVAVPDDTGTILWSATLSSFGGTGFTLNVDDASASDCLVWAFAIQAPPSHEYIPTMRRWRRQLGRM